MMVNLGLSDVRGSAAGKRHRQQGFTLIELSIVLTIIGLIVGGILKGQELINNARLKTMVAQIDNVKSSTLTFQDRYGYLPGDDPTASSFGFASTATTNGDGKGTIDDSSTGSLTSAVKVGGTESVMVWPELTAANLISGYFVPPANALTSTNNTNTAQYMPGKLTGTFLWLASFTDVTYPTAVTLAVRVQKEAVGTAALTGLSVGDISGLDAKYDDGLPYQGSITIIDAANAVCASAEATTATYKAAAATSSCAALFAVQ